jgi:N4-gp56 family major capsid protein
MSNSTSINSELFQNLLVQSQFALYENSIARAVATVFDYPVGAGKQVSVPIWAGITAQKPGEGVAPAAADTETNSKTINLLEHVVYAEVTDFLRDSAQESVIGALGAQAGLALAEALDKELIALFLNAAVTQEIGSAGTNNTIQDIMKAAAMIRSNKYSGPLVAMLHPKQAYAIKAALTATTAYTANTNIGNAVLDQYFIGNIAGVAMYESALITEDNANDASGCVFAPAAFGLAQRGGITMEEQRQAAKRSTDLVLTAVAGAGILRPELAVRIYGDNVL